MLGGQYEPPAIPDHPSIRRVLDIGAGADAGAFACWVFLRHYAFVDCYEQDFDRAEVCRRNAPPGAIVHEQTAFGQKLPPADLLKITAGTSAHAILDGYRHLARVGVVMFEWCGEDRRASLERLCERAGLRLFKSVLDHVSRGHEVWIRSRAVWNGERYVLPGGA